MECLIFDLDDTLYPLSSGISVSCANNILEFMVERLHIPAEEALPLKRRLYKAHGTSMAGLVSLGYTFDFDEFHQFVHGRLPYDVLCPDLALRSLLLSLPHRKLVFTNADRIHAEKVLSRLGVQDCFERVICFETFNKKGCANIVCKPSLEAFQRALSIAGVDPSRTLFFDDSLRNIEVARLTGLRAVLVGQSVRGMPCIETVHDLKNALPILWQTIEEEDVVDELMLKLSDELMHNPSEETRAVSSEVISVAAS
ncbi:hypothetical protein KP509_20G039400 [Ceratopteris richardii]|uniref:Pyridoxal phosphatase n=2 Tax=Ceratopteris richardii TaxID=49495 RepID=A0A8T2SEK2_CERRI|nr:hypothetical protein KP509_20G039400 [Ceratopteris richardii]